MAINFRQDQDLEFLKEVSNEDLDFLVKTLTIDPKDGEKYISCELTEEHDFIRYQPNHHQYWKLIAGELQLHGGNTIANLFRGGEGVLYREILTDVCDKLKVNYNKNSGIENIETQLLAKILEDSLEKMSQAEIKELANELKIKTTDLTKQGVTVALQAAIRMGGFKSYQLAAIVANSIVKLLIGRGIAFAGNAALMRTIGIFAGPIGWALTGAWTVADLAGPAYRITIPSVIMVAYLRAKLNAEKQ